MRISRTVGNVDRNVRRLAVFFAILLLGASLAAAQPAQTSPAAFSNPLLNEVVRMSNAGVGNETIIAYIKARQARLDYGLTADDLIELRRAGVGEPVVRYLASLAGYERQQAPPLEYSGEASGEGETVAVEGEPYGYTPYYGGWGWGWGWPYWGWGGSVYFGHGVHGGHGSHGGHWGGGGHGGGGHGGGHGGGGHGGGHGGGGHGGGRGR
jgi:hypothetical protein